MFSSNLQIENQISESQCFNELYLNTRFDIAKSSVPYCKTNLNNFTFETGINSDNFGIVTSFGNINLDNLSYKNPNETNKFSLRNNGINLFYGGIQNPLSFGNFSVSPFIYAGDLNISKTDFYYFIGNGKSDFVLLYGVESAFHNHSLNLVTMNTRIQINNLESDNLFVSNTNIFGVMYSQLWKCEYTTKNQETTFLSFKPFIGYFYAQEDFSGQLTMENQKAVYFIFDYYNIDFNFSANVLFTGVQGDIQYKKIQFKSDLITLYILHQNGEINRKWQKLENLPSWLNKISASFFADEEDGNVTNKIDILQNCGIVTLDLHFLYNLTERTYIYLSKLFIIPYKISLQKSDTQTTNNISFSKKNIINYLLSGICVGVNVEF